jgi:hypothetical protein
MAAYALAWVPFRFSNAVFLLIFALQVVPLQMALLPLLQLFNLGWFGLPPLRDLVQAVPLLGDWIWPTGGTSFMPLWIAHSMFALPLAIFLLHNFIAQLPRDLFEAARVDGASHFLIFRKLVLPLSVPAIASFAIFQFLWVWNDLLVGLTFAGGTARRGTDHGLPVEHQGHLRREPAPDHRGCLHRDRRPAHRVLLAAAVLRPRPAGRVGQGLIAPLHGEGPGIVPGPSSSGGCRSQATGVSRNIRGVSPSRRPR